MARKKNVHLEKDEINRVAARLFAKKGYAATTMRDIADALHVSIASVYYYYKNKEDILYSIIDSIGEELLVALKKAKTESDDPLEQLRWMIFYQMQLLREKGNRVKVYIEEQHNLSRALRKIILVQHRAIYDLYADQLKSIRDTEGITCEPPSLGVFAIMGTLNWCYRWFRNDGELSIEEVGNRLTDLLLHGIINKPRPCP